MFLESEEKSTMKSNVAVTLGKSQQHAKVESESSLEKRKGGKR